MRVAVGPRHGEAHSRLPILSVGRVSVLLVLVLIAGNLFAIAPASAQATEPFATATVVPQDVVSYTVVPLRDDSAQWTQALTLLERAGLGPALQQAGEEILGTGTDDELPLELFLGGEMAVVLTDTAVGLFVEQSMTAAMEEPGAPASASPVAEEPITEAGIAVVFTADSPGLIELSVQEAITDTAQTAGAEVQRTEHAGVAIEYVTVPSGREETPLAVARVDDYVLIAGYPSDLEPLIETSVGDREPLAELDAFGEVQAALDDDHLAFGFVNRFPSEATRAALQNAGLPGHVITGQSTPGGYLLTANELGFGLETVSLGGAGADTETAFPEPLVLSQTPSDVILFFAASDLAGTGILDAIGVFLLSASGLVGVPAEAESLDEMLDAQFDQLARMIGVNLRADLLQQLTGDYGFWLQLDPPTGAINALFASGVADPAAVSSALFQITLLVQSAGSGQMSVISRPVGEESRVFAVETGDLIVPRVEYGVVEEQLVVGLGSAVDNVGDGPETPLAENEAFQTIMSVLPEASAGIVYVDLVQAMPLLSSAAQTADMDGMASEIASDAASGDAHSDCDQYASQAEAQAAYDEFAPGSFQLDQDFDGEACEDYFNPSAAAAATPEAAQPVPPSETGVALGPETLAAFTSFGMVAYEEDGNSRTSSLLLVVGVVEEGGE